MAADQADARVFLVEDHQAMRRILTRLVNGINGVHICGAAATAENALEELPSCNPALLLVDISLPGMDGIELIRQVAHRWPAVKSLALSGHEEKLYARAALKAGASGYVMKGEITQLVTAIHSVLDGQVYVSQQVRDSGALG